MTEIKDSALWKDFARKFELSERQLDQFKKFYELICINNELFNLTTITQLKSCLKNHFEDSLALGSVADLASIKLLVDVGSGAGFPGIPLKIKYPHLDVILIEVNNKKIGFLRTVIEELGLTDIEVYPLDWRTFLRTTDCAADIFCARASLQPEELMRLFKPASPYKNARLFYWASEKWEPTKKEAALIESLERHDFSYKVDRKNRILVSFKHRENDVKKN